MSTIRPPDVEADLIRRHIYRPSTYSRGGWVLLDQPGPLCGAQARAYVAETPLACTRPACSGRIAAGELFTFWFERNGKRRPACRACTPFIVPATELERGV